MPFAKGQSGNPGGGRKGAAKKEKQIRELLMHLSPKAIKAIERILDTPGHDSEQFAIKEVLDRVWGKAPQAVQVSDPDGNALQFVINLVKK